MEDRDSKRVCICYMLCNGGVTLDLNESQAAYMKEADDGGWKMTLYIQSNTFGMGSYSIYR